MRNYFNGKQSHEKPQMPFGKSMVRSFKTATLRTIINEIDGRIKDAG